MFFFRAERTGTNVKGFGLMSHVPVIPLKVYVLSVVHILARGNPQQTTETDLGCVGAREASVLRSTEHHPHDIRFVLPTGSDFFLGYIPHRQTFFFLATRTVKISER